MTRSSGDFQPRPLKRLFTANQCWTSFLDAGGLRDIEVEAVTKMLACGTRILGVKEFGCDNPDCHHVKYLTNSCGSRACPSCGKKATDLWTATQLNRLPDCDRVHLVFTLPDTLWPVFESNRWLLNDVCRLAVENLLYAARKRGLEPGIFCAIHTYGRRLNWHPHQASSHRQITGLHRGTQKYTCFHSSGGIILRDKYQ